MHMTPERIAVALPAVAGLALAGLALTGPASAVETFSADLRGDQEVPEPVVTEASGSATLDLDAGQDALTFTIQIVGLDLDGSQTPENGLDDVIGLHFHDAPAGVNGSVVFGLIGPAQDDDLVVDPVAGTVSGAWDADDGPMLTDFVDAFRAQEIYLNVHTPGNTGGEIRGQVVPDPAPFTATLTGDQEVPNPVTTEASGMAMLVLNAERDALDFTISIAGLDLDGKRTPKNGLDDVIGLHFHNAAEGVNGPIVFGLIGPAQDDDLAVDAAAGTVTGSWDGDDAAVLADFVDAFFAEGIYLNVHTPGNTGGEIRGQVRPVPEPGALASGIAVLAALSALCGRGAASRVRASSAPPRSR